MGTYTKKGNETAKKYFKERTHTVAVVYRNEEYDTIIKPAAVNANMPTSTFFRTAVLEKIARDKLIEPEILKDFYK